MAIETDAARAVEEWPLLALLTHLGPAPVAALPRHMQMAVEAPRPPVAPRAAVEAVSEPTAEPAAEAIPDPEPETPSRQLSPLEQLFLRAEQTGKPQSAQPSVFSPSVPPPLKAPTPSAPPMQRTRPAQPKAATAAAARSEDAVVMIEPQPRQWRELDAAPERLFERVGGR